MNSARGGATAEGLVLLHQRLEAHFDHLRARRDESAPGTPLFALEHGLSGGELTLLHSEVIAAVQRGRLPRGAWLPFIVYAAEVGYEYAGEEYWQTFEARTPRWAERGDRDYIRTKFKEFQRRFRAAEPSGAWARHFSIICWPVTHAVLPTDLQRHLARLLFEYRRALTGDLLDDPEELGRRLAARSWQASSRFQNFAQNTALLGQVAVALLVGDDEDSPYLLLSTLQRIVADLSEEREARRWLRDAKSSATQARTRGFRPPERTRTPGAINDRPRLPAATDPDLLLRRDAGKWWAHFELPDFSLLAERLPMLQGEVARLRARVAGVGAPLARGRLLYPGQQLRLAEWPEAGAPLIQLEAGSPAVNSMLADQCVLSPGSVWVFRIREEGIASEVRGKFVRPGHRYVFVRHDPIATSLAWWISDAAIGTAGVNACEVTVPETIDDAAIEVLKALGVGAVTDVEVRPVGLVPAGWDGEGQSEWLAAEEAMFSVRSSRDVAHAIAALDGTPELIPWNGDEVFLKLSGLEPGTHELQVSLLSPDVDAPIAEGAITIVVRSPHTRPGTGSFREGLLILADPVSPTLDELWDGRASLQILGPATARVRVEFALVNRRHRQIATHRVTTTLPVDGVAWEQLLHQIRGAEDVKRLVDDAEACTVRVSHPELGAVVQRCDREFAPMRWSFGRDREGPYVRLIDNTDGTGVAIERYGFDTPDTVSPIQPSDDDRIRWAAGGLIVARWSEGELAVVLPPQVRGLEDLRPLDVAVGVGPRCSGEVRRLIEVAALWKGAALPADPFGESHRVTVLSAITRALAGLICGQRWAQLEDVFRRSAGRISVDELVRHVGDQNYQRGLARALQYRVDAIQALEPAKRVVSLATALALHARQAGVEGEDHLLAEFLLRLASDPGSLPARAIADHLELVLVSPVLLRAARFLVLAGAASARDDGDDQAWRWD